MSAAVTRLPSFISRPAAGVYGLAVAARNQRFDRGIGVRRLNVPVISVGNITVGGVGKSPFIRHLARILLDHRCTPVIAMRGYGARDGRPADEEMEHAEAIPEVQVVADPDRIRALGGFLPRHPEVDCVLLDDGFQHRWLHRDLDFVLVSARHSLGDRLLPAGRLREPPENLHRASAVIVTHAPSILPALAEQVERLHGHAPLAWTRHVWSDLLLRNVDGSQRTVEPAWLRGRRVTPLLAVGDPDSILLQFREQGANVSEGVIRRDHAFFTRRDLERVSKRAEGADALVMTGKDWVRTRDVIDFSRFTIPIVIPQLQIEVFEGSRALHDLVLSTVGRSERNGGLNGAGGRPA